MTTPDLNLLLTLDALLTEGSVARAATRLRLSPSAMSRALQRVRDTVGDPLLVRAGRGLVPTPRAIELREEVHDLVERVTRVLRPAELLDIKTLARTFVIRARGGLIENFGADFVNEAARQAPDVRLHFLPRLDRDGRGMRDAGTDLEIGVIGAVTSPEIRSQALLRDCFVAVMREDHPCTGRIATAEAYCRLAHVSDFRHEPDGGPVQAALNALDLKRDIRVVVSSFGEAIRLAAASDLVATVPELHTRGVSGGVAIFPLPFETPDITVSMMWHPRLDADPAHRWLRQMVRSVCASKERKSLE